MGWIDPRDEEHLDKRWPRNNWQLWVRQDAHRFMKPVAAEKKVRAAQAEADEAALVAEQEAFQQELLQVRRDLADLKFELALRQLGLKYEGQPRDELGQFAEGRQGGDSPKDPGLVTRPAFLGPAIRVGIEVAKGIEAALALFAAMSARNSPSSIATLEFNARAFQTQPIGDPKPEADRLTREQVDEVCPRRVEVQRITNQAASMIDRGAYPTTQAYGTAVHTWVRDEINGPGGNASNPNFRSEVSFFKSEEVKYGDPDSKRVDVYENPGTGTVCIYDIKTSEKTGLTISRMQELATNVGTFYPSATRIIVTEVRPAR